MGLDTKILSTAFWALLGAPSILNSIANANPAFAAAIARKAYNERPDLIPDLQSLVRAVQTGAMSLVDGQRLAKESGYTGWIWDAVLGAARQFLSPLDYITLERRGTIKGEGVDTSLAKMGFQPTDIENLRNVTKYLPTPEDAIRFAVRDIYDPARRAAQQLDDGFPADFGTFAEKVGMDLQTAMDFWAAHWQLPSPTQVFEMLHRGVADDKLVDDYLIAADYIPIWRDRLKAISYDTITRIDARNMYKHGLVSEGELQVLYQKMGYSPDDAAKLVQLTVSEATHTDTASPKANVIANYKAGTVEQGQAILQLTRQGYSEQDAVNAIQTADAEIKQELIDLEADAIIDQYARGLTDINSVRTALTKLGVSARMMDITIARELAQARKRIKGPSKSDLDKWYIVGLIGDTTYKKRMQSLGYLDPDIALYLAENQIAIVQGADAKKPYAFTLRSVANGAEDITTAETELQNMGYDQPSMDIFAEILASIVPQ